MGDIEELKKKRVQFLEKLYEMSKGDEYEEVGINHIGNELGFDPNLNNKIVQNMIGNGFATCEHHSLGDIGITHKGILEVERISEEKKNKENKAFVDTCYNYRRKLYDITKQGREYVSRDSMIEEFGISKDLNDRIEDYLEGEGLISFQIAGYVNITHKGIKAVVEENNNNDKSNSNVLNIYGNVNNSSVQQAGAGANQQVSINEAQNNEIRKVLQELKDDINKHTLETELLEEINADIESILYQLKSPKPKAKIIHEGLSSVKTILEVVKTFETTVQLATTHLPIISTLIASIF